MKRRAAGFSYVEVVLATVLLAVCIVPATNALRNGASAPQIVATQGHAMLCIKNQMEKVIAEPYHNLVLASGTLATPSATYSLAADSQCPARNIYIAKYNPDGFPNFPNADTGLLYINASVPDGAVAQFPLTTLVAR
ncbi:hypothetical protein RCH09_002153 [Actimicrobium sp. GrIS 1.19]|uniref:hypothetical protein n=1 Tax=Actimicrobium sp. GrIS 1.19 TaxID=3071708 RepID=UPI002E01963A|nr:hypothetical protein [Actimicrobium sp. GrIS 1.19]